MAATLEFQLVGFILSFACCSYACIFADPDASYVGRLRTTALRAVTVQVSRVLGEKLLTRLSNVMDHAFQIVYLVLCLGSWYVVFVFGFPLMEAYLPSYHRRAAVVLFFLCMGSWHYACHVGPGNVTARTIPLYDHYEYDNLLYTDRVCPTLKIRKIARSKYSGGKHIPRFDHFCGWLNQAIGERNYRWFLLFLVVNVGMYGYATWVFAMILYGEIVEKKLLTATFVNAVTGEEVKADKTVVFHYLFARHFQLCTVLMLMSVMTICVGVFLAFHLYITSQNLTTNEFFKWRSVRRWHKKERQKYEQALKDGTIRAKANASPMPSSKQVPNDDVGVGCMGPVAADSLQQVIADDEVIDPGPMPKNIYNKGIIQNFSEIFYPLSLRDEATQRFSALRDDGGKSSSKLNCASEEKKKM